MKKSVILFAFVFLMFGVSSVFAVCNLDISLVNQDPYPAIPGEEVKVVFQVDGIESDDCGDVRLEFVEEYPLSLSPGQKNYYEIESGTFSRDFQSFFLAPFKVRVADNALDGDTPMEIQYKAGGNNNYVIEEFDLNIDNIIADFEVYVKDYDFATRTIVFEILNIAEADVEALTVEVPKQDSIVIKGSKVNIVGDLDSNEYTTADFEALPDKGEITVKLSYSDSTNVRRTVEKTVLFESEYFEGRLQDEKPSKTGTYVTLAFIVLLIVFWIYRRNKKKKALRKRK
jgi:hypothetical protein